MTTENKLCLLGYAITITKEAESTNPLTATLNNYLTFLELFKGNIQLPPAPAPKSTNKEEKITKEETILY